MTDVVSVAQVKEVVCRYFDLPALAMVSQRRSRSMARPRQIAMALCAELTPLSLPAIGRHFGGRDHTTVMHAITRVRELKAIYPEFAYDLEMIRERLGRRAA